MFKEDVTNIVSKKDLQMFCRLHFLEGEPFTITNTDNLEFVEFTIPTAFNEPRHNKQNIQLLSRVRKIYEEKMCDLRSIQVVVHYLGMIGLLKVSGKIRVTNDA